MSVAGFAERPATVADRSLVLPWALAASVAFHGGLLVAHFGGSDGGHLPPSPPVLQATLQPASTIVEVPSPSVLAADSDPSSPQTPATPPNPDTGSTPPTRVAKSSGAVTPSGNALAIPRVPGQLLADRSRLGELFARQMVEFPIEIDQPVRMPEPITVRYPPRALAQGREDSVGVWVVVNAEGNAEEVQVLDGTPEFADEVVAAIRAARFTPAQDRLQRIRFPLALEFQFRADADGVSIAATAAAR